MEIKIEERLRKIKLILLDVDGTMTDGGIYINADGTQTKRFNSLDGEGIRRAMDFGIEVGIVSAAGMAKDIINTRAKLLGITRVHAERSNKLDVAKNWALELNLSSENVAYMGDDIIDVEVMKWCGISSAPANSHKTAKEVATYITNMSGGNGAVREFIDLIMENQS